MRVTLASIGDAVIATDAKAKVTFLNPLAETLTGWSLEAASGQPVETILDLINEGHRRSRDVPGARSITHWCRGAIEQSQRAAFARRQNNEHRRQRCADQRRGW